MLGVGGCLGSCVGGSHQQEPPGLGLALLPPVHQPGPLGDGPCPELGCHLLPPSPQPRGLPASPGLPRKPWEAFLRMFGSCCTFRRTWQGPQQPEQRSRLNSKTWKPEALAGRPAGPVRCRRGAGMHAGNRHFVGSSGGPPAMLPPRASTCRVAPQSLSLPWLAGSGKWGNR